MYSGETATTVDDSNKTIKQGDRIQIYRGVIKFYDENGKLIKQIAMPDGKTRRVKIPGSGRGE